MISIHLDTSLESLPHLLESTSPACSALVNKSFILAVMVGFVCLAVGSTPDTCCPSPCQTSGESLHSCCGDDPHLVGLPVFPLLHLSHAVVMVLSLSGFSDILSIIWSSSSLMVVPGKRSCPQCCELNRLCWPPRASSCSLSAQ